MKIFNLNLGNLALALLVAGAFIVAECGSGKGPTNYNNYNQSISPSPQPLGHFHSISIQNFAFSPGSFSIPTSGIIDQFAVRF